MKKRIKTLSDFIGSLKKADFESFQNFKESAFLWWLLFIIVCFAIATLATFSFGQIPKELNVGTVAPKDIKADRNYEIVDEEATEKFRQEAVSGVLAVYDFDRRMLLDEQRKISETVKQIRETTTAFLRNTQYKATPRLKYLTKEQLLETKLILEAGLGIQVGNETWDVLVKENLSEIVETSLITLLVNNLNKPIITDSKELMDNIEHGITVRQIFSEGQKPKDESDEYQLKEVDQVVTLEQAKALIKKEDVKGRFLFPTTPNTIETIVKGMIAANFTFNRTETETRQNQAARSIKSVIIKLQAGESIIRSGARYEPWHIKVLNGVRKQKEESSVPLKFLGIFIVVALTILSVFYFAEKFLREFITNRKDIVFMTVLLMAYLIFLKLGLSITSAVHNAILFEVPYSAFYYILPVAAGTMLLRMVLNAEVAIIFAMVCSVFTGIFAESYFHFGAFTLISSIVASIIVASADKRANIIKSGVILGVVNVVLIIGFRLISAASYTDLISLKNIGWYIVFAFTSGIGSAFVVLIAAPIVESLFDYTTDIKLLELANLNHPLLRELIIRAPGTYHHSHLVGILSEAAAEAIGANALLTRVAAYYHDIGKIKKPMYFIENQRANDDRYEKLSPHMSALIVASHVKDGLEMAKNYKLPMIIIDVISQHHGTKMISFFYNKALEQTDEKQKVQEKDFRYQGPKPQTREAGILLLADAAEAAVRSLKEKSTSRIQQTIQDIINKSFSEAQLDECDLTLRDLNLIAKAFSRISIGIYHQRLEYPSEDRKIANVKNISVVNEESYNEDLDSKPASTEKNK